MRLIVENMLGGIVRESTTHLETQNRKIEGLIKENCSLNTAISMIADELNDPFVNGVVSIRGVISKVRQLKALAIDSYSPRKTFTEPTKEDDTPIEYSAGGPV